MDSGGRGKTVGAKEKMESSAQVEELTKSMDCRFCNKGRQSMKYIGSEWTTGDS